AVPEARCRSAAECLRRGGRGRRSRTRCRHRRHRWDPRRRLSLPRRGPVLDVWDVMDDRLRSKQRVLVFDDHGFYPALDAVERVARAGQQVTYVSPERTIGIEVGSMNSPAYLQVFSEFGVEVRLGERLAEKPRIVGEQIVARLRHEYSDRVEELTTDAVVVDFGTAPNDEVYFALKPRSSNH